MAHVLLIYPYGGYSNLSPPLGLLHLAAVLMEKNISVDIIDVFHVPRWEERMVRAIDGSTICVGISTMSGDQQVGARNIAQWLKREYPSLPIVFGGVHPSLQPDSTLACDFVDAICIGEAERSFPMMIECFREKRPLDSIPGIGFKRDGQRMMTPPPTDVYDLDTLPLLPYERLDVSAYAWPLSTWYNNEGLALTIETSRGCPYRCYYCVESVYRQKVRRMSPSSVLRHVAHAVKWGAKYIVIADDNFFAHPVATAQTLPMIRRAFPSLPLFLPVRADLLTESLCREWSTQPLSMMAISTESGSERMLQVMGKHARVDHSFQANACLARYPIHVSYNFIIGFPEEKLDDIIATYVAIVRLIRGNRRAKAAVNKLIPTPGSTVYANYVLKGFPDITSYEGWENIRYVSWENAPFLDAEVRSWEENTRYFLATCRIVERLRTRPHWFSLRWRSVVFYPVREIVYGCIQLRARARSHRRGLDTTLLNRLLPWIERFLF